LSQKYKIPYVRENNFYANTARPTQRYEAAKAKQAELEKFVGSLEDSRSVAGIKNT